MWCNASFFHKWSLILASVAGTVVDPPKILVSQWPSMFLTMIFQICGPGGEVDKSSSQLRKVWNGLTGFSNRPTLKKIQSELYHLFEKDNIDWTSYTSNSLKTGFDLLSVTNWSEKKRIDPSFHFVAQLVQLVSPPRNWINLTHETTNGWSLQNTQNILSLKSFFIKNIWAGLLSVFWGREAAIFTAFRDGSGKGKEQKFSRFHAVFLNISVGAPILEDLSPPPAICG